MTANHSVTLPRVSQVSFAPISDVISLNFLRIIRGLFLGTLIIFASLIALGIIQIQGHSQVDAKAASSHVALPAPSGAVYALAAGSVIPKAVPDRTGSLREVHIANTGLMLLRGATVVSTSNGVIRVGMEWGTANFTWTLNTDSSTKYLNARGLKQTVEDIRVGDIVTVTGMLANSGSEPILDAQYVREN